MRIIFLLRSVVMKGGIERVLVEKANWMAKHDHKVMFLTYEQGNHSFSFELCDQVELRDLDCRYFTIYKQPYLLRPFYAMMMRFRFSSLLYQQIRDFQADAIVIPHNVNEYYEVLVSILARLMCISLDSRFEKIRSSVSCWWKRTLALPSRFSIPTMRSPITATPGL